MSTHVVSSGVSGPAAASYELPGDSIDSYTGRAAPSPEYLALNQLSGRELERTFVRGTMPDLSALAGWEFRGMNTPMWARAVGIKKFVKGFYRPSGNRHELFGYNCPVEQNRLPEPWRIKPSPDYAKRFGFYLVHEVDPTSRDNVYLHSVLLDYSKAMNHPYDPTNGLRDYMVQVSPDNPDLYLGKAYYALGNVRVPTSFFVLERFQRGPADPHFCPDSV